MPKTLGKEIRKLKKGLRRELPKSWNEKIDKTTSNLNLKNAQQLIHERSERGRMRIFGKRKKR